LVIFWQTPCSKSSGVRGSLATEPVRRCDWRTDRADQVGLRSGMDIVQVLLADRLRHELPHAFIQRSLGHEVGAGPGDGLTRSFLIDGHFLSMAGALKSIWVLVSVTIIELSTTVCVATASSIANESRRWISGAHQLPGTDYVSTAILIPRSGSARRGWARCSAQSFGGWSARPTPARREATRRPSRSSGRHWL
jgi:hypothetical protein